MRTLTLLLLLPATTILSFLAGCTTDRSPSHNGVTNKPPTVDFVSEIKPILEKHCVICHNPKALSDHHSFESRRLLFKGDAKGPIIIPGNPEDSRLITAIRNAEFHEQAMPPIGSRISARETLKLEAWIREGAAWPRGAAGKLVPVTFPLE